MEEIKMKLYVKEKLFSIHRKFYIRNEKEEDVFEISSKIISIGDKTSIKDMDGNDVSYIEQEIFHFMPTYNIYIDNSLACKISKKFQLFKNDYFLDNGFKVIGNFWMLNFIVYDENDIEIANISRKFFSIGDQYVIEIHEKKNLKLALSIIVAIANDVNRSQNTTNNN
ncbi:hypothetical protein EOM09_05110 [bacterium]|nr:hypothetical protein [bacterium]